MEAYNVSEQKDVGVALDGNTLAQEIGGESLKLELKELTGGAGIKDKSDLADLLSSIKGAQTFMGKTPKS